MCPITIGGDHSRMGAVTTPHPIRDRAQDFKSSQAKILWVERSEARGRKLWMNHAREELAPESMLGLQSKTWEDPA